MKKKIFVGLTASVLALSYAVAIAPSFKSKASEVKADPITHVHDQGASHSEGMEYDKVINQSFFSFSPSQGWTYNSSAQLWEINLEEGKYYFAENISLTAPCTLNIKSSVYICLNGKSITYTCSEEKNKPFFNVFTEDGEEPASLTIDDCNKDNHSYHREELYDENFYGIVDAEYNENNIPFSGGYFTKFKCPIINANNASVYILSGNFVGNLLTGQIEVSGDSSLTTSDAHFGGNFNRNGHNLISLSETTYAEIDNGSTFMYNEADYGGGAVISTEEDSGLSITQASFEYNKTGGYAGVIYSRGELEITGSNFKHNEASDEGGAIRIQRYASSPYHEQVKITNSNFVDNYCSADEGRGAAIFVGFTKTLEDASDKTNTISISNSLFEANGATREGGAIFLMDVSQSSSTLNLENCTFKNNHCDNFNPEETQIGLGGAISYRATTFDEGTHCYLNVKGSTFENNRANQGAGVFMRSDPYSQLDSVFENCVMKQNHANQMGGAILVSSYGQTGDMTLTLKGTTNISENHGANGGGGIYASNAVVNVGGSVKVSNNGSLQKYQDNLFIPVISGGGSRAITRALDPDDKDTYVDILEEGLTSEASIGINMEEPGDFTRTLADGIASTYINNFTSDVDGYYVNINKTNNQLMLSTERPTPPTPPGPGPTPEPTPEDKPVYEKDGMEIDVPSDFVMPSDVTIRVEVRADIKEASSEVDYNKIKDKLNSNEYISKVYDVKLIKTEGGVETEIQPSDLREGMKLKVKITLPKEVSLKGLRILHIHSVDDMEFVNFSNAKGRDLTFEVSRLSQFAFINKQAAVPGWGIALIVIGSILLLFCLFFLIIFFLHRYFIEEGEVKKAVLYGKKKDTCKLFRYEFRKSIKFISLKRVERVKEETFKKRKDAEEFLEKQKQADSKKK